jgi:hypothetical protein
MLEVLRDELVAGHPVTGPYSADNQEAADEINAVNRTLPNTALGGSEVLNAVDATEYADHLDATGRQTLWDVCHLASVNLDGIEKEILLGIFPQQGNNFPITRAALGALSTRPVSRAEELGLVRVRSGTVAEARALP